jgi:hypothetical protein
VRSTPPPARAGGGVPCEIVSTERFDPAVLEGLDQPVRRYLTHALAAGTMLGGGARLDVSGRIRVGAWLRFDSIWEGDGRSLSWRATSGPGPLRPLRVHDSFRDGAGFMDIRLRAPLRRLPALKLLHAEDDDVARSGAGRAALEALWVPPALLPGRGVTWRAESDELLVASWPVPPETPEVHIAIDPDGAVRSYRAQRWHGKDGYVPFGADVHAERTFGGVTVPSRLTAGWWHGTDRWAPFFEAEVTGLALVD